METCAKTGSTDDYVDRWLCGMTPYYTAACWFGYDNNQEPMYVKGKGLVSVDGKIQLEHYGHYNEKYS